MFKRLSCHLNWAQFNFDIVKMNISYTSNFFSLKTSTNKIFLTRYLRKLIDLYNIKSF